MNNLEIFLNTYKECLKEAVQKHPEEYSWPISELDSVFERMKAAVIRGTFNKDGQAFKSTCKRLKIKHTYKDIDNFIKSI